MILKVGNLQVLLEDETKESHNSFLVIKKTTVRKSIKCTALEPYV
jgi:hypothetical protein